MAVIRQKLINRSDLQDNPNVLYLFGDNEIRQGYGGQAGEMRDEPNAIGIRTCNFTPPWKPRDFKLHIAMIREDLEPVWAALKKGRVVVIPTDGLGTGIADLKNRSPYALAFIDTVIGIMQNMFPPRA